MGSSLYHKYTKWRGRDGFSLLYVWRDEAAFYSWQISTTSFVAKPFLSILTNIYIVYQIRSYLWDKWILCLYHSSFGGNLYSWWVYWVDKLWSSDFYCSWFVIMVLALIWLEMVALCWIRVAGIIEFKGFILVLKLWRELSFGTLGVYRSPRFFKVVFLMIYWYVQFTKVLVFLFSYQRFSSYII